VKVESGLSPFRSLNPITSKRNLKNSQSLLNDFGTAIKNALENVKNLENSSKQIAQKLVRGEVENFHEVMISAEKARIALQFTVEIRNKIISAYKEIMKMPI